MIYSPGIAGGRSDAKRLRTQKNEKQRPRSSLWGKEKNLIAFAWYCSGINTTTANTTNKTERYRQIKASARTSFYLRKCCWVFLGFHNFLRELLRSQFLQINQPTANGLLLKNCNRFVIEMYFTTYLMLISSPCSSSEPFFIPKFLLFMISW